ncbi:MAG: hypothetical protein HYS27_11345 [Deltaproteobacteria bacterium]|nr:hypothetical protein [Deltaproteobacteria bacterium]
MQLLFACAALAAASTALADDDVGAALAALKAKEPPIEAVQAKALEHFGIHPERVAGMRAAAAWKAAVPTFEVTGGATGATIDDTTILDEYDATKPWVTRGATGSALEVRTTLAWDLPRIVYNAEELDVAGLANAQRELIARVTGVYFARRRAQLALVSEKDPVRRVSTELRVEELTALLSGMTGGWFAEALKPKAVPATTK